jgi:hypothetical protein
MMFYLPRIVLHLFLVLASSTTINVSRFTSSSDVEKSPQHHHMRVESPKHLVVVASVLAGSAAPEHFHQQYRAANNGVLVRLHAYELETRLIIDHHLLSYPRRQISLNPSIIMPQLHEWIKNTCRNSSFHQRIGVLCLKKIDANPAK